MTQSDQATYKKLTPVDEIKRANRAFRIALILLGINLPLTVIILLAGQRIGASNMMQAAIITGAISLASFFTAIQSRLERSARGMWILIGAILFFSPLVPLLAQGYGWIGLFAIPLFVTLISRLTLPPDQFSRAIALGSVSGVATLLLDIFGPENRPEIMYVDWIVPISIAVMGLIIAILLIRNFATFTLLEKLLTMFLLVTLIPLSVLAFVSNRMSRDNLIDEANQVLSSVAQQTSSQLDELIDDNLSQVESEANLTIFRNILTLPEEDRKLLATNAVNMLRLLESKNPESIQAYLLLNKNIELVADYPQSGAEAPSILDVNQNLDNELRRVMLTGDPYVSPVLFDTQTGEASILFAGRTTSKANEPLGLLLMQLDADLLQSIISAQNGLAGPNSFGVLYDQNYIRLAHGTDPEARLTSVDTLPTETILRLQRSGRLPEGTAESFSTNMTALAENLSKSDSEPIFTAESVTADETTYQVATEGLATRQWTVAFFQPRNNFLAQVEQQTKNTIVLVLGLTAIVALTAFGASRLIGAPLVNLTELVERIAAGDLSIQVTAGTEDEIGRLATSFNHMTAQLRNLLTGLEDQVERRTEELAEKANQLQAVAEVSRDAATIQNLDTLLNRSVDFIHERFGYYHAGFFLLDQSGEYAVLQAANSEGGKQMLEKGHQLKVGEVGVVGDAASTGRPYIALDVDADTTHFAHPFLPDTRSEIALPLRVGDEVIGVLDIQSVEINAFDEDDMEVLQLMADQLAMAIHNSRLLSEVQQTVQELEIAQGLQTQAGWQQWARSSEAQRGFRYNRSGIQAISSPPEEAELALRKGRPVLIHQQAKEDGGEPHSILVMPIWLRGEVLGVINMTVATKDVPTNLSAIVEDVSTRLALNLENARLLEETQRRVASEQLTSEITSHIRESLHMDDVLQTAVREIGESLHLHDVSIQLNMDDRRDSNEKGNHHDQLA